MRALHLVDTFEPRYERDQIQNVKMCRARGFDTTVITSRFDSDGNLKGKSYFRDSDEQIKPVRVIRPISFRIRLPGLWPILVSMPHVQLMARYDVVHAYTMGSYYFVLGTLITRGRRSKLVVRAEMSPTWHKRIKTSWFWRRTILALLKKADAVYAFTHAERDRLLDVGVPEQKAFTIPVSIDYERLSAVRKEGGDCAIGYFGRFVAYKGSHRLVDPLTRLAREFPSVRVVFAGPRTDAAYAEAVMGPMRRSPAFEYAGIMSAEDFYRGADIVLVPSLDLGKDGAETGSISTLEAMACGKAVIASDISPMNEYIEHGVSGLLAGSDDDFYRYCKQLVQDPSLVDRLGGNAREKAREYDVNRVFDALERVYSGVISGGHGAR